MFTCKKKSVKKYNTYHIAYVHVHVHVRYGAVVIRDNEIAEKATENAS